MTDFMWLMAATWPISIAAIIISIDSRRRTKRALQRITEAQAAKARPVPTRPLPIREPDIWKPA